MAQASAGARPIRTPDQRLRVFVSSTLRELAPERRAARTAIEQLRLAPVMFELGARPHPPRELYRAYLEQSDVFVGIYWERYGWVAAGEPVSGLEDEYNLVPAGMPKLIYLKESDGREDRLTGLINRIQDDDTASYVSFRTEGELREHLANDLATLLAERFDQSAESDQADAESPIPPERVPVSYTPLVGRLAEVDALLSLVSGQARVVTIIGAGGIGKSRLAIEVAHQAGERFADGVVFVPLENVLEPELLFGSIARALGIRDSGEKPVVERLGIALAKRRSLIVLDNFEQIIEAAPSLVQLYPLAPEVTFLVTSRALLRIRGEQVFELGGLPVPPAAATLAQAAASPAVQLFVQRAEAVSGDFELSDENTVAVSRICQELDGLPLAIELAAARMRLLTAQTISDRLDDPLWLLASAARDLPERQRTLRATIEWSCNLLTPGERELLFDLGVFAGDFTYEAVEAIGRGRSWAGTELEGLSALVDNSLLRQEERGGIPVFSLLTTVRELALDELRKAGELETIQRAHAAYYTALARSVGPRLRGAEQVSIARRLELERPNLGAAARYSIELGRPDDAADLAWSLLVYWWFGGYFGEVRLWMQELLAATPQVTGRTRAIAVFLVNLIDMWLAPTPAVAENFDIVRRLFREADEPSGEALALACASFTRMSQSDMDVAAVRSSLEQAVALLESIGDAWGAALALVGLGRLDSLTGAHNSAAEHYERGGRLAREHDDVLATLITDHHIGRVQLFAERMDEAEQTFTGSVHLSASLGVVSGVADGLEGLSAIAAHRGDAERAGLLAGAAAALRQRVGFHEVPAFVFHERYLDGARQLDPSAFAAAEARGSLLSPAEAAAVGLPAELRPSAIAGLAGA